ncbi:MAG TPA: kelch repeat-containing protein [Frankiaceae bacterium]|nr:kelch repeat-containing protein [Frankiaceae bacterium]
MAALAAAVSLVSPTVVTGAAADPLAESWMQARPATSPPVRSSPAMTYDERRAEVVLFGGYGPAGNNPQRTDTWVWDGAAWTQRFPATNPGYCPAAKMTYDSGHGVSVLFCGYNGLNPGATWTWDGTAWRRHAPAATPSPRQHYALTYDAARGETVLFGGRSNQGPYLDDTWVWTGSNWVQRTPAARPSRRTATAVYDGARREVVLFGGTGDGSVQHRDTWTWDGATWTERKTASAPPGRWAPMMTYDSGRGAALLFGGGDLSATAHDDTWSWDGATWTEVSTVVSPPGRYDAGLAYHAVRGQAVLFGGAAANSSGGYQPANDTWTLDSLLLSCGDGGRPARPEEPASAEQDVCCAELPTDEKGNVVLPPEATDVEVGPEEEIDNGSVVDRYPNHDTADDEWYGEVECPWSIGGDVPQVGPYLDLDRQLGDAGFTSTAAEVATALDTYTEQLATSIQRPDAATMIAHGRIAGSCPGAVTAMRDTPVFEPAPRAAPRPLLPRGPGLVPPGCVDNRKLAADGPFGGRDVIFVHGLDKESIDEKLGGAAEPRAEWPEDAAAFTDGGYWKERAKAYWDEHITRYLKGGNAAAPPTNRYLVVSWASTQNLGHGVHAFLSQAARAMTTGAGVVPDASGDKLGFCAKGCVIQSHSTGGPLVDVSLGVARLSSVASPFTGIGNLRWIADRMRAHVAYMGAYSGSHYATVMAWLGWHAALSRPACELADWVGSNAFGFDVPCSWTPIIGESVLTDLAVPVMQTVWQPLAALTPVPALVVAGGHPSAMGEDESAAKPFSAVMKMLFHHGGDDGVLSMDSQCAASGSWRHQPMSYFAQPSAVDLAANAALRQNLLPPVISTRAFDMGSNPTRALRYYVDQVVGAHLGTPAFWRAVITGTVQPHFDSNWYRVSASCHRHLSPTGMVQPVLFGSHPMGSTQARLPRHYSFLQAASDHRVGARGEFDTLCYEVTVGSGRSCTASTANTEEVNAVDDRTVYTSGLVSWGYRDAIRETVKGKAIRFKLFGKKYRIWIWKRTYHRLANWHLKIAPDYVYAYVLKP